MTIALHQDVVGLQIAVQLAGRMQRRQAATQLRQRIAERHLIAVRGVCQKVRAVDELHREIRHVRLDVELVQHNQVGMCQIGERSKLALEGIQRGRPGAVQKLERQRRLSQRIERLVDAAVTTATQAAQQAKAAD